MRVVIVSDFGEINGGAAKVALTSAHGLAEAGIDVTFVCAKGPVSSLLEHPRIEVRNLGLDCVWDIGNPIKAALGGIWNMRACGALDRILQSYAGRDTVVHFHQWTKALSPSVMAVPYNYGMPSAVSLHDYFFVCPSGTYYRYPEKEPCKLKPLSASCVFTQCDRVSGMHKAVRTLRQVATGWAAKRAGASLSVISVSPFAESVVDKYLPKVHPRYVVRSPVAMEKSAPAVVAGNRGFVYAGRLTEEKGVWHAVRAAESANLPLTLIGDGPLFDVLRERSGLIRCTGWLEEAALLAELQKARALVFPSTWYETGGLVVLEALAQGVPVIVSSTTAAAEYVVDGVNGYVVEPGNEAILASRMLQLSHDDEAARMGREAYDRYWRNPLTLSAHAGDLISVYGKILASHRPERRAAQNRTAQSLDQFAPELRS